MSMDNKPNIYFFTGAGLSAPSGISTFRDKGGLWDLYDINVVCNYVTWKTNRDTVFDFYTHIFNKYMSAEHNKAHKFIADVQKRFGVDRVKVITQNVDNLLEKAGCDDVLHLHGKVGHLQCTACATIWEEELNVDARCIKCNSLKGVKPYVIMFGENAPNYRLMKRMFKKLNQNDIFIIIGTMGNVVNLDDFFDWKKNKYKNAVKYYQTNYILNVMDDNHLHKIPDDEEFYGKESCETYLPKIKDFIYGHMDS